MIRDEKIAKPVTWKYPPRRCLHCDEVLPRKFYGPPRAYCSDRCRQRACRERKAQAVETLSP